jgi:thioredoxin reductase
MTRTTVIIVGCGPAGIACAIQLKRMGLEPVVVEKNRPGGMLFNASLVENYPGFPGGISGENLAALLTEQARNFGLDLRKDEIRLAEYHNGLFQLSGLEDTYACSRLVLATGTVAVFPKLYPGELIRKGLIHTDMTKLRSVTGKDIGIIGAGDAAFDYAVSLAQSGNSVSIYNRGNRVKALKALREKAAGMNGIHYYSHHELYGVSEAPDNRLCAFFGDDPPGRKAIMDYLIFATGRAAALDFLDQELKEKAGDLAREGRLFVIGDAANGRFRQVSVAVGDGVRAAMEIFEHESNQQDPG